MELGATVKDKITEFEGLVTGKCSYITGCDQFLVQPKCKEGAWIEAKWFDENRLEQLDNEIIVLDDDHKDGPCGLAPIK